MACQHPRLSETRTHFPAENATQVNVSCTSCGNVVASRVER